MKRISPVFESITDFQTLRRSALKARQGTRRTPEVSAFFFHLETELFRLQEELLTGAYQPGAYRHFKVYDPKERVISVAPFRDRVVHHALVGALEPHFERVFIPDSYACRKGKGTHKAIERAQFFLRKNRWFLKSDIEKFFESVPHERLLEILGGRLKEKSTLQLAEKIVRNGNPGALGLPIGNLTSQFFANVYLHELDFWVKHHLKCRFYVRYMDDFVLFSPEKSQLLAWRGVLQDFLTSRLILSLKPSATFLNQASNGLRFLGVRIFPNLTRLHRDALRRGLSRLKKRRAMFAEGAISEETLLQSMASMHGHWQRFDTRQLSRSIFWGKVAEAPTG